MRQTFADEIIARDFFPNGFITDISDGVVIKSPFQPLDGIQLDMRERCIPVFDTSFLEWQSESGEHCVVFHRVRDQTEYPLFLSMTFIRATTLQLYMQSSVFTVLDFFPDGLLRTIKETDFPTPIGFKPIPTSMWSEVDRNNIAYGLYCTSLLHQKHEIELVTPSRQVSRQVERKTGKKPSPYFEIKVEPSKPQKRYTSTQKTGRSKNAHIVRGNFATYTEDAPLLGKYTGTFWRPAHARGVADGDKPEPKNYRIVLPKEPHEYKQTP